MPLPLFLALLACVMVAAGASVALVVWMDAPLVALGLMALAGSFALGARQWR